MNWRQKLKPVLCTTILSLAFGVPLFAQLPFPVPVTVPNTAQSLDYSGLAREAQAWLADLIRIDTTNPPGNEQAAPQPAQILV